MKRIIGPASVLACLLSITGCESIQDRWMMYKVERLAQTMSDSTVSLEEKYKVGIPMMAELFHDYPLLPPIGQDSSHRVFRADRPATIGNYRFVNVTVKSHENDSIQEFIPGMTFSDRKPELYYTSIISYENPAKARQSVWVIDRGGYGGWACKPRWKHLQEGFIGKEYHQAYTFAGTSDIDGQTWAGWTAKKNGEKTFTTWWKDRFEVVVHADNPDLFKKVVNANWPAFN